MIGIYKIKSLQTEKFYIGSSINIEKRFIRHIQQLKNKMHSNLNLQKLYDEYGEMDLHLEVLEILENKKFIFQIEQWYLDNLKPSLNINLNACGGDMISNHPNKLEIRKRQIEGTRKVAATKQLRLKRSFNAKKLHPNGPMHNKNHKDETLKKFKEQRGIKILIDDVIYFSFRQAEKETGICRRKISKCIKNNTNPNWKLLS
jgi:group I intron endonuclease